MATVFEHLGDITCPSGMLVIIDGGNAGLWSGERSPVIPRAPFIVGASPESRDLKVHGPDACSAATLMGGSGVPYLYDQGGKQLESIHASFSKAVAEHKLDARLETLPDRIPHRRRMEIALETAPSGVVEFHNMKAIVVGGVPRDRLLPVRGERMESDPHSWRTVWVELAEGTAAVTSPAGLVSVDEARLLAIDAFGLETWDDWTTQDGLADVAIWGQAAASIAAAVGASANLSGEGDKVFGWADLPIEVAKDHIRTLEARPSAHGLFVADLRPHSHHWAVMRDVRSTRSESGTLDVGGSRLCMFMTSWGDGYYPVEVDYDAGGRPLRVRIELGSDEEDSIEWPAGMALVRTGPSDKASDP